MSLIVDEYPHTHPWWSCLGCWKLIALAAILVALMGLMLREMLMAH
jgi:hypothetical protein